MTDDPSHNETARDDAAFEELLAGCIEAFGEGGWGAVQEVFDREPEQADRLRTHLAALQRSGLLGSGGDEALPSGFGPYRVVEPLGQGGMSQVYRASDDRLGREVALKVSAPGLLSGSRGAERFAREIRAVMELEHPCIVPVHDVGEAGGRSFFTMDLVAGRTLGQVLEVLQGSGRRASELTAADMVAAVGGDAGGRWGSSHVETVCRIVLDIADGLSHAHEQGIVHRDVKPSNVMLREDGRAQLFDFGLAQLADQPALTRSGEFTGTPFYLAPEQLAESSATIDGRTDVYALGVTLYELLTLERPFAGETTAQVFRQILSHEAGPPSARNAAVPRALDTLCAKALEREPHARYASMQDLAADLRRFLAYEPIEAREVSLRRRVARWARRSPVRATLAASGLVLLLLAPVVLASINRQLRAERDDAQRQLGLRNEVVEFLIGLFELSGDAGAGARDGARELLESGAAELASGFEGQPDVRAALMVASARAHLELELFTEAGELLDRAFAIQQRELGEEHVETAETLAMLAEVRLALRQPALALDISLRALGTLVGAGQGSSPVALRCRLVAARAAILLGDAAEARELLLAALERCTDPMLEADLHEGLAEAAERLGDGALARQQLLASLALHEQRWSPDLDAMGRVLMGLAELNRRAGLPEEAAVHRERALSFSRSAFASREERPCPFELEATRSRAYREEFQAGITAHLAGRHGQAAAAFERCTELLPEDPVAPYNLACSLSLAGRPEEAASWLDAAREAGYAGSPRRARVLWTEPELEAVRASEAGQRALAALEAQEAACDAERDRVLRLPPPGAAAPVGTLVVLHADGGSLDEVVESPWAALAAARSLTLLAVSAPIGLGLEPSEGMGWVDDEAAFLESPRSVARATLARLQSSLVELHSPDRRAWIAGEGLGATVALEVALAAPGLFEGALLVNGAPHPSTASERARAASALGTAVEVLLDGQELPSVRGAVSQQSARSLEAWLRRSCRLRARVQRVEADQLISTAGAVVDGWLGG